jgi:hypothetical protein
LVISERPEICMRFGTKLKKGKAYVCLWHLTYQHNLDSAGSSTGYWFQSLIDHCKSSQGKSPAQKSRCKEKRGK